MFLDEEEDFPVGGGAAQAMPTPQMDPMVKDFLAKKYDLGQYSTENRQKLIDESAPGLGDKARAALASVGAGFMGKDPAAAGQGILQSARQEQADKLGAFDKGRANAMQDIELGKMSDANTSDSADSLAMQEQVGKLFPNLAAVTKGKSAAQIKEMLPLLGQYIQGQNTRENARIAAGMRSQERQDKLDEVHRKEAMLDDKQVNALTDIDNADSDLRNLISGLGNKSSWTGPVDGRVPDLMVGDDQVAWRSAVGKYKDAYRKAITGAGAGMQEVARLESRLPSETDSHANFVAKANEALKELARRKHTIVGNYSKMGKDVSKFAPSEERKIVKQERNKRTGEMRVTYADGTQEIIPSTAGN